MKEIKLYQCDICGTRYTNEKIAKECENNHVTKLEIVDCIHWKKASREDGFPGEITVESADGRERNYRIYE